MAWGVAEASLDEGVTDGARLSRDLAHGRRDVAGAIRTRAAEAGHRSEVVAFGVGGLVYAGPEEPLVQVVDGQARGRVDFGLRDRRSGGNVPGLLAELLEEVRIALGVGEHSLDRGPVPCCAFLCDRFYQRPAGVVAAEGPDLDVAEQALGVGAGLAGEPWQRRKAGAGDEQRESELGDPVEADDERAQLVATEVLDLVDREKHASFGFAGGFADLAEHSAEVAIEVAGVGETGPGFEIDREPAAVACGHVHLDESAQRAQRGLRSVLHALLEAELEEDTTGERGDGAGDLGVLGGLDVLVDPAVLLADAAELIEEHGLADTSETGEQDAALEPSEGHALHGD